MATQSGTEEKSLAISPEATRGGICYPAGLNTAQGLAHRLESSETEMLTIYRGDHAAWTQDTSVEN